MPPVREVEVEVLPKGAGPQRSPGGSAVKIDDPLVALVARLMDSIFTIPGTGIKVGLDPLIGLIPGVGSGASALVSLLLIVRSAAHGVPNHILARMAGNVIVNAVLDVVPVVGDALSVFYRSNDRNYALLQRHAGTRRKASAGDWIFLVGLLLGLVALVVLLFVGMITVVAYVFRQFTGHA